MTPATDPGKDSRRLLALPAKADLDRDFRRLLAAFGPQNWWPADGPFEVIVGAVLTQNTSWHNVELALTELRSRRLLKLRPLLRLTADELAGFIQPAGYPNVKARRLLNLLIRVNRLGGVAGLRRQPTAALRETLLAVNGVGPETADSILLYALHRPSFVIDAYTRRILTRHRYISGRESYDELKLLFETALPRDSRLYNEYHALLVALAKRHCRVRPDCRDCPLSNRDNGCPGV